MGKPVEPDPNEADPPEFVHGPDRRTILPFIGALVVFIVLVSVIAVLNLTGPDGDDAVQQIGIAAAGQNDALQRADYADFVGYTCDQERGTEAQVLARQRDSVTKRGERYLDDMGKIVIDGDRATAQVTYHFDKDPDAETTVGMSFALQDGSWKVCSPGPV